MSLLAAKLLGKQVKELDDNDIDELLSTLSPEELEQLNSEVDPDVKDNLLIFLFVLKS